MGQGDSYVGEPGQRLQNFYVKADIKFDPPVSRQTVIFYQERSNTVHSIQERLLVKPTLTQEILMAFFKEQLKVETLLVNYSHWKQRYSTQEEKENYFKELMQRCKL